jgi:protein-S-isoprenylcysteine O-methyltransferase Ste14
MTISTPEPAGADRPNTLPWPPLLYAGALAAGFLLHWIWPLAPLIDAPLAGLIGVPLLISGLAFGLAAIVRFRVVGTPIDPTARAKKLATAGIYRLSRNPMYVGAIMALLGLGLATRWTWLVLLTVPLPALLYRLAIAREEAYLERHFAADYQVYRSKVRRWL